MALRAQQLATAMMMIVMLVVQRPLGSVLDDMPAHHCLRRGPVSGCCMPPRQNMSCFRRC